MAKKKRKAKTVAKKKKRKAPKKSASKEVDMHQVTNGVGLIVAAVISFLAIKFFWIPLVEPFSILIGAPMPVWIRWALGIFMFLVLYGSWIQQEEKRQARQVLIRMGK